MTNTILNEKVRIDVAIKNAITLLQEQDFIPKSPGEFIGGEVNYCAAAAVAAAGYHLQDDKGMSSASALIKNGGTSEEMIGLFEELGWDHNIGRTILQLNDSLSDEERKSQVIEFLSNLQVRELHA